MIETRVPPTQAADRTASAMADEALAVMTSDREEAKALALQALKRADDQRDADGRCHALLVLAQIGLRHTDYSAALPHVREALALGSGHAQAHLRDLAQHVRATWLRREGSTPAAMALLTELHARAHQRPPLHAFFTVTVLAVAQSMAGDQEAAMRGFYEALELAMHCGNLSVEVNALNNAGSHHLDLHNLEDARPMLERCLNGALRLGSRRQTLFAAGNLAQCYGALGLATEALAVVRQHLMPLVRPDDDPLLNRDPEIAQALIDNGLWDEARTYLARAPQLDPQSNDQSACRTWLEARLMMTDGQPQQALAHCQARQAQLAADDDSTMPLDVLRVAELAATAAAACGDHAEAYRQMSAAHSTQDRLLGRAARARFASLQIQHEVQRAVQERDAALQTAQQLAELNASLQAQVAANATLTARLESLALEDALTGLHNRRHLFQAGPALLNQARRDGHGVTAVMIDLDHFKQVNDRYGHEGGDQVLKAFAGQARAIVRGSDLCCRYGGEEFVLLLGTSDLPAAVQRVRDLLAQFSTLAVAVPGGVPVSCSFSAGISVSAPHDQTLDDLLKRADGALYEAKRQGRRRVAVAAA